LNVTLALSVVAAVMVALALIVASVAEERQAPKTPSLAASRQVVGGQTVLAMLATVGAAKKVELDVQDTSGKTVAKQGRGVYLPTDEGFVQTSIPIVEGAGEVVVIAEWQDAEGMKVQLSRKVAK
jgi:hypothetical protein